MAYSELVKNFNRIRDYMREFYVYGFKSREEYTAKSARSYDDERRRLESWLGDAMRFRQTPEGKNVFISIDSRALGHNPLYKAWKAKSFTGGEITLHFLLFDILPTADVRLSIGEIMRQIDEKMASFAHPKIFDESTVRKKLREYEAEGLILTQKAGKTLLYSRAEETPLPSQDVLDYFSEVLPCGVIGSFLLDRMETQQMRFAFKHHYITETMDSEALCAAFSAIREKRSVVLENVNRAKNKISKIQAVPLKVMVSAQSGRQYLMAYVPKFRKMTSFRMDNLLSIQPEGVCEDFDRWLGKFEEMLPHIWGVSTQSRSGKRMEHVEFTIQYAEDEPYIKKRLEREKRCGKVEHLDAQTSRFSADVYDASELIPWIRTFICRITEIHFSDKAMEEQFKADIREMYALYGLEENQ